jgi:hypothetical protein
MRHAELPYIVYTLDALSFGFGPRQRRQEHSREDGDDRDDDEQFD